MRYLRFRIIADRAELSEASHACSRLTGFFGTEKTERLTRWPPAAPEIPGARPLAAAVPRARAGCGSLSHPVSDSALSTLD